MNSNEIDPELVDLFRDIRQSSMPKRQTQVAEFGGFGFSWGDGVTTGSVTTLSGNVIPAPFPCRINKLQIVASTLITASFSIYIASYHDFPSFARMDDTTLILTAANKNEFDVSTWPIKNVQPDSWLKFIITLTSGSPNYVGLHFKVIKFRQPFGTSPVTDNGGNNLVDDSGNPIRLMS